MRSLPIEAVQQYGSEPYNIVKVFGNAYDDTNFVASISKNIRKSKFLSAHIQ
jgi:hypothetical protein